MASVAACARVSAISGTSRSTRADRMNRTSRINGLSYRGLALRCFPSCVPVAEHRIFASRALPGRHASAHACYIPLERRRCEQDADRRQDDLTQITRTITVEGGDVLAPPLLSLWLCSPDAAGVSDEYVPGETIPTRLAAMDRLTKQHRAAHRAWAVRWGQESPVICALISHSFSAASVS